MSSNNRIGYSSENKPVIGYSSVNNQSPTSNTSGFFGYSSVNSSTNNANILSSQTSNSSQNIVHTTPAQTQQTQQSGIGHRPINTSSTSTNPTSSTNVINQTRPTTANVQTVTLMDTSSAVGSVLSQYGYTLSHGDAERLKSLQPGQTMTVYATGGRYGALLGVTYHSDGTYTIRSTTPLNVSGQWVDINKEVRVPTATITYSNGGVQNVTTTSYSTTGNIYVRESGNPNSTALAAYSVSTTVPIIYQITDREIRFSSSTPQVTTSLQSVNVSTSTQEQQTNQNTLWFGYSSVYSSQTNQTLPENMRIFINPIGYSSLNPNTISYVGVNFDTNTVYLLNTYGQIMGTQTFNNTQAMFDYLKNRWAIDLTPTSVPGQAILAGSPTNIDPKARIDSIISYNDELVRQAIKRFWEKPTTALQAISTIATAGASTALTKTRLIEPAERVQRWAERFYYDPVSGNIAGAGMLAGTALLTRTAPRVALHAGVGSVAGWGLGEATSIVTGHGPLSPSEKIAAAEIGALFSAAGSIMSPSLSVLYSRGAGKFTEMITHSKEAGSKVAGLTPAWRFTGEFTTNTILSYPFFHDNPNALLLWSTGLSTVNTLLPGVAGAIASRLDAKRGTGSIAEIREFKTPLATEPVKSYVVRLPSGEEVVIVPRPTYGEGRNVWEFGKVYADQKSKDNLIAHVTPDVKFVNRLARGEEIMIKPSSSDKAESWRVQLKNVGMYYSPGESNKQAVALAFYAGITDTRPYTGMPNIRGTSIKEEISRFVHSIRHPFERGGIILANRDIEWGPLPPRELVDFVRSLQIKHKGDLEKITKELLNHPKYGPMYMQYKNAVIEHSARRGVPVIGTEDVLGLAHERQVIIEPGAKLRGLGYTHNAWLRQTPELLEKLPGPMRDILSDWHKLKIVKTEVKPGEPINLYPINTMNTRETIVSTRKENTIRRSTPEERYIMYREREIAPGLHSELIRTTARSYNVPYSRNIYETLVREPYRTSHIETYRELRSYIERGSRLFERFREPYPRIERGSRYLERTREPYIYYREYAREYPIEPRPTYYPLREPYNRPREEPFRPRTTHRTIPPSPPSPFGLPFIAIPAKPSKAIETILEKPQKSISDVAYAFYTFWR
ncbi:MAG: hypothetical protein ACO2ON_01530 [Candidatus Nanopusillus sp.]